MVWKCVAVAFVSVSDNVSGTKLFKIPTECSVNECKCWLGCQNQKIGAKKEELVLRVQQAINLKLLINPKVDKGKWYITSILSSTN